MAHKLEFWMQRTFDLASLAKGNTSPNPLVGCVILDKFSNFVGEGFHAKAGEFHAEIMALKQAGAKAKDGTLIVNLEPCCHFGRTPPCTSAILEAGIKKVVIGMEDPDIRVAGRGISILQKAGLDVVKNVLKNKALVLNKTYIHRIQKGRPWGILKWAMSLDGRVALPNGESKWISNSLSRDNVHKLRGECDAVIVGGGTVRHDNPLLTSRGLSNPEPLRVIFSQSLDLPKDAHVWDTDQARTIVVSSNIRGMKKNCLPMLRFVRLILIIQKNL